MLISTAKPLLASERYPDARERLGQPLHDELNVEPEQAVASPLERRIASRVRAARELVEATANFDDEPRSWSEEVNDEAAAQDRLPAGGRAELVARKLDPKPALRDGSRGALPVSASLKRESLTSGAVMTVSTHVVSPVRELPAITPLEFVVTPGDGGLWRPDHDHAGCARERVRAGVQLADAVLVLDVPCAVPPRGIESVQASATDAAAPANVDE